jgi:hypothetical protein
MKKLNNYFFGDDEISFSDMIWFYGTYGLITVSTILIALVVYL